MRHPDRHRSRQSVREKTGRRRRTLGSAWVQTPIQIVLLPSLRQTAPYRMQIGRYSRRPLGSDSFNIVKENVIYDEITRLSLSEEIVERVFRVSVPAIIPTDVAVPAALG